ncbi:hypothetical protein Hanom_Chr04g00348671 [Helianthus anomalus]
MKMKIIAPSVEEIGFMKHNMEKREDISSILTTPSGFISLRRQHPDDGIRPK